ncbi:hypothetical protein MIMGU_mgv1a025825mg, partial [Erythranthe guttata]
FLDRAAIKDPKVAITTLSNKWHWQLSTLTDVEEVKLVIHAPDVGNDDNVVDATTMNRHITASFQIPAASLTVFFVATILLIVAFYDRLLVPLFRKVLKNPQGLTPLQRMGVGLVLSIFAMVTAALTEVKRLGVARSHLTTSSGTATSAVVPLSVFWLVPQFFLVGSGEAFTYIGQLDFFLRECPKGMKTMSTGLFLSTLSLGFFVSSILVSIVHKVTGQKKSWLADNLNQGKLYNFYWLLAILSTLNLVVFLAIARGYVYKEKRLAEEGIDLEEEELACH